MKYREYDKFIQFRGNQEVKDQLSLLSKNVDGGASEVIRRLILAAYRAKLDKKKT
jgi:hypothetical protein